MQANINTIEISDGLFKNYSVDDKKNIVTLYNMDNTEWKKINLIIPENAWLEKIEHISTNILNKDSQIEIAYTYVEQSYSDVFEDVESIEYNEYSTKIINENGIEILTVPGGNSFKIISENNEGTKFLIDIYNKDEFPSIVGTQMYSVNYQYQ